MSALTVILNTRKFFASNWSLFSFVEGKIYARSLIHDKDLPHMTPARTVSAPGLHREDLSAHGNSALLAFPACHVALPAPPSRHRGAPARARKSPEITSSRSAPEHDQKSIRTARGRARRCGEESSEERRVIGGTKCGHDACSTEVVLWRSFIGISSATGDAWLELVEKKQCLC